MRPLAIRNGERLPVMIDGREVVVGMIEVAGQLFLAYGPETRLPEQTTVEIRGETFRIVEARPDPDVRRMVRLTIEPEGRASATLSNDG